MNTPFSSYIDNYSNFGHYYSSPITVMQNMLQYETFQKFRTGKVYIDLILLTATIFIGSKINNIISGDLFKNGMNYVMTKTLSFFNRNQLKVMEVPYITDSKEINEIYTSVFWYISKLVDTKQYHKSKIEITETNKKLFQYPANETAKFIYNKTEISYTITIKRINIYADREYIKENSIITLNTFVNKNSTILTDFCLQANNEYKKYMENMDSIQSIYRNKDGVWNSKPQNLKRKLDTVILKKEYKKNFINDLNDFLNSEEWYLTRDIPYSRNYMFYGIPGTGKTSLIKSIANFTKRSIHYLILSSIKSDEELFLLFENINYSKTIIVIEDIDCATDIINKRDNESKSLPDDNDNKENTKLTLSGLLNVIDGNIINTHGKILIMTTNHRENIDEALLRHGRVDFSLEFNYCDKMQVINIYKNFFDNAPILTENDIDLNKNITPADVVSICIKNKDDAVSALKQINLKINN